MRVFVALTYYRPYTSGLTIYAERVARALVTLGHEVTVLTSRHDPALPTEEVLDGVRVVRAGVAVGIGKGLLMPGFPLIAWKLARQADVIHIHLPQLDGAPLAIFGRLLGKRVIVTYHCDLQLPAGAVNRIANITANIANHISAFLAHKIATNTRDYAENSPFLRRYLPKVVEIYPPAVIQPPTPEARQAVARKANLQPGEVIIGMAARLATEKGVEYMIEALPRIREQCPNARVLFVGPYQNVPGEQAYAARLAPEWEKLGAAWSFLGVLADAEFSAFLSACAVTVLPSVNGTESFGMVQIEAMLCGTPVIASDLPGVRVPVRLTGMGRIIPPANAAALAQAVLDVLTTQSKPAGLHDLDALAERFSPASAALQYQTLFQETA